MKILGINGSPRKDGNTACAVKHYLEQFGDSIETEYLHLEDYAITPCKSCFGCRKKKNERCVYKDDTQAVYQKIKEADALVLGSPVYLGSISPQLANLLVKIKFLDRGHSNFREKLGIPIIVGRRAGHNFAMSQLLQFFFIGEMIVHGSGFWNIAFGGKDKGSVIEDQEGIDNLIQHAWQIEKLMIKLKAGSALAA